VFLDRQQVAEASGEAESAAWAPEEGDFAGWGGSDLFRDLGRCVLPEHNIVQGAFSWGGRHLTWRGLFGPLGLLGAGLGRRHQVLSLGAKKTVVDDGDRLRLIDQGSSQKGEGLHVSCG